MTATGVMISQANQPQKKLNQFFFGSGDGTQGRYIGKGMSDVVDIQHRFNEMLGKP